MTPSLHERTDEWNSMIADPHLFSYNKHIKVVGAYLEVHNKIEQTPGEKKRKKKSQ
jgi:hypothetical protein